MPGDETTFKIVLDASAAPGAEGPKADTTKMTGGGAAVFNPFEEAKKLLERENQRAQVDIAARALREGKLPIQVVQDDERKKLAAEQAERDATDPHKIALRAIQQEQLMMAAANAKAQMTGQKTQDQLKAEAQQQAFSQKVGSGISSAGDAISSTVSGGGLGLLGAAGRALGRVPVIGSLVGVFSGVSSALKQWGEDARQLQLQVSQFSPELMKQKALNVAADIKQSAEFAKAHGAMLAEREKELGALERETKLLKMLNDPEMQVFWGKLDLLFERLKNNFLHPEKAVDPLTGERKGFTSNPLNLPIPGLKELDRFANAEIEKKKQQAKEDDKPLSKEDIGALKNGRAGVDRSDNANIEAGAVRAAAAALQKLNEPPPLLGAFFNPFQWVADFQQRDQKRHELNNFLRRKIRELPIQMPQG